MKKKKLLVALLCASAALGTVGMTTSCKKTPQEPPVTETETFKVTFDSNGGSAVASATVEKGKTVSKPTDPTQEGQVFAGWFTAKEGGTEFNFTTPITKDTTLYAHWTKAEAKAPVATLVYNNGAENGSITAVKEGEEFFFTKPTDPEKPYNTFLGWYDDQDARFNFDKPVTGNVTLTAKWEQGYDTVNTVFNFDDALNGSTSDVYLTETTTIGRFTFGSAGVNGSTRFEASRKDLNTGGKFRIRFELKGDGTNNSITIAGTGASSGGCTISLVKINAMDETGKVTSEEEIKVLGENLGNNVAVTTANANISGLEAGIYELATTSSFRLTALSLTEKLPQSATIGIELNTASVQKNFLLGRDFNSAGLVAYLAYENGRQDLLSSGAVTVTVPEDFKTAAGVKEIVVDYQLDTNTKYTQKYSVNVCEVESLVYYDYTLNTNRETLPLQTVFALNSKINHDNLVVKAKCLLPGTTDHIEFLLSANEFEIVDPELTTTGNKTVSIQYKANNEITVDYTIEVVEVPDLSKVTSISVTVDPEAAISTAAPYNFKTINQTLQFIALAKVSDEAAKNIVLKQDTVYHEKVEINMPNVTIETDITGLDLEGYEYTKASFEEAFEHFAIIEFGALNGMLDPSESVLHSSDGSATFSVRPDAVNFVAQYVTFKNHYNTNALYKESLTITSDSQAVALLVQADQAVFGGCKFTSYHDTLYAQTGRHHFLQCFIEGHTDYIFGYNATSYFENCYIKSIGAGADPEENGNYNNGGYIVATKGFEKSTAVDGITYGYVFEECNFVADDATAEGSVSIARGWGDNMSIMVMNSMLGAHISKEAYGFTTPEGKNMNDRYGKMDKDGAPVASKLLEYNNTGAGALTTSLTDTCTVLTEDPEWDILKVFCAKNGNLQREEPWGGAYKYKDATVVVKDQSGNTLQTIPYASYVGSTITKIMLDELFEIPEGYVLDGYFADQACETAYDFETILKSNAEDNVIYAKLTSNSDVTYTTYTLAVPESSTAWAANSGETLVNDIFYVMAGAKGSKTESLKNGEIAYGELKFGPQQISLTGGKASTTDQSIKIVLEKEAKVTIYCGSKNDKTITLSILDKDGNAATYNDLKINDQAATALANLSITAAADKYEFTLAAGTYYIGGSGGGCYIYGMTVSMKD